MQTWDYAQPLNKDIGTADNKLEHFLKNTSGHFHAQQQYTWKGKECRAALDHVRTWYYHLPPQTARPISKSHKKFDHCQIWTQLPNLDFPKRANTARTTQPDFSQRIDKVFFKRHVDDWKVANQDANSRGLGRKSDGPSSSRPHPQGTRNLGKRGQVATR